MKRSTARKILAETVLIKATIRIHPEPVRTEWVPVGPYHYRLVRRAHRRLGGRVLLVKSRAYSIDRFSYPAFLGP